MFTNIVKEGDDAKYVVFAFAPNETVFNPTTKLDTQDGTVSITFTDDSATGIGVKTMGDGSQDFNNTNQTTIALGQTITTATFDDYKNDNNEVFKVSIVDNSYSGSYSRVTTSGAEVLTTIIDSANDSVANETVDTVYIKLDTNAIQSEAQGATLTHTLHLIDKDNNAVNLANGEVIEITLSYSADTTQSDDFVTKLTTFSIVGDGGSEYRFSNVIADDFLKEDDESYTIKIDSISNKGTNFENVDIATTNEATGTISDETVTANKDSVTLKLVSTQSDGTIITDPVTIKEGESSYYKAILVDANGTQITDATGDVDVVFSDDTAIRTGSSADGELDFTASNQTIALNTVFSADANDDYIADNNETFKVQLTDNTYTDTTTYENVVHDTTAIITTIEDDSKPNTPNDPLDAIESDLDSVTLKLVATDSVGNTVATSSVIEGEKSYYKAILVDANDTQITTATGDVDVVFSDDTAIRTGSSADGELDFTASNQTIALNTVFSADALDDALADSGEVFKVQLTDDTYSNATSYENVIHDTTAITTTIKDDSDPSTTESDHETVMVKLVACDANGDPILEDDGNGDVIQYTFANSIKEANSANYMVLAFAENETTFTTATKLTHQVGNVTINFTNGTATGAESLTILDGSQDFNSTQKSVTLGQAFSVASFDDALVEGSHTFEVGLKANSYLLNGGSGYENVTIETSKVETTITDNADDATQNEDVDTVYVKITHNDSQYEGIALTHTISLVDKNDTALTIPSGTITVDLTYSSDTTDNTDFSSAKTTQITLDNSNSSVTISNLSLDDFVQEGDESYTLTISNVTDNDSVYENIAIDDNNKSVTGEVLDGAYIGTPQNANVDEDAFDVTNSSSTITDNGLLSVVADNADNTYGLIFDSTITAKDKDSNSITLKSGGVAVEYVIDGATTTAYAGRGRTASDKVFEITLDKHSAGGNDDNYTYTQYKNIDHPDADGDNDITLTFGFKLTDGGASSSVVNFDVVVNDSLPSADNQSVVVDEDGSKVIV